MPAISVVMPVYNVADFVADAIQSVLNQTFRDWELVIINDCSLDNSMEVIGRFTDPRIRVLEHPQNRGVAGARNSGIRAARADIIAFLDADDSWAPEKLAAHFAHLSDHPQVGVSFSRSVLMTVNGRVLPLHQMPRLRDIRPEYFLRRNPIGNGSAPVIRRAVLEQIAVLKQLRAKPQLEYFDEDCLQSVDIECWIRIALCTDWVIEGIPQALTRYRLRADEQPDALHAQLAAWRVMVAKVVEYAPEFIRREMPTARAYQLRYLARQAVRMNRGGDAMKLCWLAVRSYPGLLWRETGRTCSTMVAALALVALPGRLFKRLQVLAQARLGAWQQRQIERESALYAG